MERVTISVSDEFAAELAFFMKTNHYGNRSEAVCDLARRGLRQAHLYAGACGECVATLSYVFKRHRQVGLAGGSRIYASDDCAPRPSVRWLPLSRRAHQLCGLALFPVPIEPAHG